MNDLRLYPVAIKPEVIYFTDNGVGRGAMMIIELTAPARFRT